MPVGKRAFDVVVGIPACVMAIPLIAVLALVLWAQHRANPFFVHDRIGHGGRRIPVPKLRTLAPGTDPYADKTKVTLAPPTGFARFLRVSHLDELPQLFLVPLGLMSLVGPRPRMALEAEQCGDAHYETVRTSVPQGCTGLWQISADKGGRVSDHPEYDRFYVEQRTLRLDAWITWRTVRQMLSGGTITLDDVPRWALRQPQRQRADMAIDAAD